VDPTDVVALTVFVALAIAGVIVAWVKDGRYLYQDWRANRKTR